VSDQLDSGFEAPRPPRVYGIVPEGIRRLEIVKADRRNVPWRASTNNPAGDCFSLRLRASSEHGYVFADLPTDKRWLIAAAARAVGVVPDLFQPEELVGRQVEVEISHITTRAGTQRAVVKKWQPATTAPQTAPPASMPIASATATTGPWEQEPQPTEKKPPAAAPRRSRSAPPAIGVEDDIPF
jgi:hypothetical protein